MSYKNVKALALGHLRAAGISCGRTKLGELLCDMSCIVNYNHSKKITCTT